MKVNQKKANKIKGLFATLNKLELNNAISKQDTENFTTPTFIEFDCKVNFYDFGVFCEVTSYKKERTYTDGKYHPYKYISNYYWGCHEPSVQTVWDDNCNYHEFRHVIEFVRRAIKAAGTFNMVPDTHTVTIKMPDYLNFELKETEIKE